MSSVLFIDTETTGIRTAEQPEPAPRLVSLAAILDVDGVTRAAVHLIVRQFEPVPAPAVAVHGITAELAERCGISIEALDVLLYDLLLRTDVVVAHNYAYDADVIEHSLPGAYEVLAVQRAFCTQEANTDVMKLAKRDSKPYWTASGQKPELAYKYPSLKEAYKYYTGLDMAGAHDALNDARACREVYYGMVRRGIIPA